MCDRGANRTTDGASVHPVPLIVIQETHCFDFSVCPQASRRLVPFNSDISHACTRPTSKKEMSHSE